MSSLSLNPGTLKLKVCTAVREATVTVTVTVTVGSAKPCMELVAVAPAQPWPLMTWWQRYADRRAAGSLFRYFPRKAHSCCVCITVCMRVCMYVCMYVAADRLLPRSFCFPSKYLYITSRKKRQLSPLKRYDSVHCSYVTENYKKYNTIWIQVLFDHLRAQDHEAKQHRTHLHTTSYACTYVCMYVYTHFILSYSMYQVYPSSYCIPTSLNVSSEWYTCLQMRILALKMTPKGIFSAEIDPRASFLIIIKDELFPYREITEASLPIGHKLCSEEKPSLIETRCLPEENPWLIETHCLPEENPSLIETRCLPEENPWLIEKRWRPE